MPSRPTTSARTAADSLADSPTPAPLVAASARQKRRHTGATPQGQSDGSTASQTKRRRTLVAHATQSTERFLTPRTTTAAPPNPPQDHPAPPPPPEPPPNPPQKPHGSSSPHDSTDTLHLRLPGGRPVLFWVLVLVGACQSGTVWAGLCLIHHHHTALMYPRRKKNDRGCLKPPGF